MPMVMMPVRVQVRRWDVTREELVLVKAVCLTYTDDCPLEDPAKVQDIQYYLLKALYLLLSRRHAHPNLALARALDTLVALRDLTDIDSKSHCRPQVFEVMQKYPILRQVLLNM